MVSETCRWSRSARPSTSPPTWAGTPTGCAAYAELGFDRIYLHHVGQDQDAFIDAFGAKVLPQLRLSGRRLVGARRRT